MNKKIILIVIAGIMLVTPFVGTVMAGKGQEKLDFVLYMEGTAVAPPDKMWTTNGGILQIKGYHYGITDGDYWVEVDGDKYYPTGYEGTLIISRNSKTGSMNVHVKESIKFADGTIEITVYDKTVDGVTEGTFTGIGTGSLAGVFVHGQCDGHSSSQITRPGVVMGWPW